MHDSCIVGAKRDRDGGQLNPTDCATVLKDALRSDLCPELLLDRGPSAEIIVDFVKKRSIALLRGQPSSGKTWMIPAIAEAAKKHPDLWPQVEVVRYGDFLDFMKSLSPSDRPRPLVIVDEAHMVWKAECDPFIKNLEYADFIFITTAPSMAAELQTVAPQELHGKQLWLSSVSTDRTTVCEWIRLLVDSASTSRSDIQKERLVENTYKLCGGHVGRTVMFLEAVLKNDGIQVPPDVFDEERSVTGGNGASVFSHPLAQEVFTRGFTKITFQQLRGVKDAEDANLMMRLRNGYFIPVKSWQLSEAVVPIKDDEVWSLGSAAQRDYVKARFGVVPDFGAPLRGASPLQYLVRVLPHWRTDLLFVRDDVGDRTPFLEKHVHQAFSDAFTRLTDLNPTFGARVVYEQPLPSTRRGHPPSLDFVLHDDSENRRIGIEFLIDEKMKEHCSRFDKGGTYAPLKLTNHLTVYFEANPKHTEAALSVVKTTRNTCVVTPCPLRGWDSFHLTYNSNGEVEHTVVPRVGGLAPMFSV